MSKANVRKAVIAAQSLLSIESPEVKVDGIWGRITESAASRSTSEVGLLARQVKTFADKLNVTPAKSSGIWVSKADAYEAIANAAAVTGVKREWLEFMLELEPNTRINNGVKEYQADSVSPGKSYFGLMQIGRSAWIDAASLYPSIGRFEDNKFNPQLNVLAAAGFAQKNVGYARRIYGYNGPFTSELIYAMHNQGHTFLSSVRQGGYGRYYSGQSRAARDILKRVGDDMRNLA